MRAGPVCRLIGTETGAAPHAPSPPETAVLPLLLGISPTSCQQETSAAVYAAIASRYSLCRFYGPLAQHLEAAATTDPDLVCTMFEQLQIGFRIEMCLPGRAWLVRTLSQRVSDSIEVFSLAHTKRLCRLTFLPSHYLAGVVAELCTVQREQAVLLDVLDMLALVKARWRESDGTNGEFQSIIDNTTYIIDRCTSELHNGIVDIEKENSFLHGIANFFDGFIQESSSVKSLRLAVARRLQHLHALKIDGGVICNAAVFHALSGLGSNKSSDPGMLQYLKGLLAGRERDEIEMILIGIFPKPLEPPPPPLDPSFIKSGNLSSFPGISIFRALGALSGMDGDLPEVRAVASFLCYELCCLLETGEKIVIPDFVFLSAVAGMRNLKSNTLTVRRILTSLTHIGVAPSEAEGRVNMLKKVSNAVSGLRKMNGSREEVVGVLKILVPILSRFTNDAIGEGNLSLKERDTSFLLSSIRSFSSEDEAVGKYLSCISVLLSSQKKLDLSAQGLALALYSLQSCDSSHESVLSLLRPLTVALQNCSETINPKQMSMCLFGLQNMSSVYPEVRALLHALLPHAKACSGELTPQGVAMCLTGFTYMSSEHEVVRALVSTLINKIDPIDPFSFRPQELAMALSGIQSLNSKHSEVQQLLDLLVRGAINCTEPLTPQGIAMCIQGFRLCHSEHEAVKKMVAAVKNLIINSPEAVLTEQGVVMSVKNLRYLSSEDEEVRELLSAITPKIELSREALDPVDFLNCMRGLKAMKSSFFEVRELLRVLKGKIPPAQGEMWWQEIIRSDVFGSDELLEDLRHYSQMNKDFYDILEYVLYDEKGIVKNIMSREGAW